jgi:hypothetical protein
MANNEQCLLSVSLSSSEQADEPNVVKEGEEESRVDGVYIIRFFIRLEMEAS